MNAWVLRWDVVSGQLALRGSRWQRGVRQIGYSTCLAGAIVFSLVGSQRVTLPIMKTFVNLWSKGFSVPIVVSSPGAMTNSTPSALVRERINRGSLMDQGTRRVTFGCLVFSIPNYLWRNTPFRSNECDI